MMSMTENQISNAIVSPLYRNAIDCMFSKDTMVVSSFLTLLVGALLAFILG